PGRSAGRGRPGRSVGRGAPEARRPRPPQRTGPLRSPGVRVRAAPLLDRHEDADDEAEQRHALDEGGRDDHRRADVTAGLRLAGRALEGGGGEAANAEAGAEGDEAGTEAGGEVTESNRLHGGRGSWVGEGMEGGTPGGFNLEGSPEGQA